MNLVELQRALRQLRCSGMATGLETRLLQAQTEKLAPIDFLSTLVSDELLRRQDRLLDRRVKQAGFRDVGKTLDEPPEHEETESPHVTLLADGIATRGLVQLQSHSMIKTEPRGVAAYSATVAKHRGRLRSDRNTSRHHGRAHAIASEGFRGRRYRASSSGTPLALRPKAMDSSDRQNLTHEAETRPELELDVDAVAAVPVDFEPRVKDWIEYLAGRLAREIIRESERTGA